ncbi:stage 0 sporulation protein B (sporulation initiation phosphotransferase) [Anoxybacillus mongoliensis]|uniref:Stage 0 sporulation protein B (Sporulation initiation phosphotransferase) n=1 Tax=Anoxybacillus mongoliensis TaxID=452565 RepID=A0A7W8N8B6_9BACL|nr:Spo0B C-terminal domain-containing protein [Anoxybacillus mongoliensis]MBB5354677.1 stage 0 sporulation protein B (sporulation initiation phosphotransferase) [Anoxybacillus mongoliensis]MCX8002722.1 sporulation initiation phosphotransferase B [Anoxybacillus mongoliensis]
MEKRWTVVEALRHSRHDWLNKIQLIKGNLSLQRIDRVNEIIQQIIIEAENEAKLTNLQIERFAELLMTYHWQARHIQLEYEVLGEPRSLHAYDHMLVTWCQTFLHMLEECCSPHVENYITITIDLTEKNVRLFFDYRGMLQQLETVKTWIQNHKQYDALTLCDCVIQEHELTICVTISSF